MGPRGLVVVGGSYAGANIAAAAREAGYGGTIRLISSESHPPYHRPPLSKGYLLGKAEESSLVLRGEAFFRQQDIELVLEVTAARLDREGRCIVTSRGDAFFYDRLALATGARARRLTVPGADLSGVFYLRSLDDARALRGRLEGAGRAVVIGGGFIGLEVASSLALLGMQVTVLESRGRLLARALSEPMADFLSAAHRRHGVAIEHDVGIAALEGDCGWVTAVRTGDGRYFPADIVIVGIGSVPNSELAEQAGLGCDDGILVDRACRTSDPAIFAAGDCTRHPSRFHARPLRLESVQNAADQGRVVGFNLAGRAADYDAVPWFWSDQYEYKLQIAGLVQDADRVVRRGVSGEDRFSLFHYRDKTLVAVESVDRPAEHMIARKLLAAGISPPAVLAADPFQDLRQLFTGTAQAV